MSFIAKNPLISSEMTTSPLSPPEGMRGLYPKSDGWYDIDSNGNKKKIGDIVVDNLMNGNSTNPVQNNIIVGFVNNKVKQTLESANDYTDTKIQELNISIDIDTEMSNTSENAVQNKVVKDYVDKTKTELQTYLNEQILGGAW